MESACASLIQIILNQPSSVRNVGFVQSDVQTYLEYRLVSSFTMEESQGLILLSDWNYSMISRLLKMQFFTYFAFGSLVCDPNILKSLNSCVGDFSQHSEKTSTSVDSRYTFSENK